MGGTREDEEVRPQFHRPMIREGRRHDAISESRKSRSTCPRPFLTTLNRCQGERDATRIAEKNCVLTQLLVISRLCDLLLQFSVLTISYSLCD